MVKSSKQPRPSSDTNYLCKYRGDVVIVLCSACMDRSSERVLDHSYSDMPCDSCDSIPRDVKLPDTSMQMFDRTLDNEGLRLAEMRHKFPPSEDQE